MDGPFRGSEQNGTERNSLNKCFSKAIRVWNGMEFLEKMFFKGHPSVLLFCEIVWNGIPSLCIFRGMAQNEVTKFWVFFSSTKCFGTEFQAFYLPRNGSERYSEHFPLRETDRIPMVWIKISVCPIFCRIFFSENGNPSWELHRGLV